MKQLYGVIGCPVHHSLSPLMHNGVFQQLGIEAYYHAFHVEKDQLPAAIQGLKALGIAGANVTIPHKTAVMPLLDEIDEMAQRIGAVNTIVNENGRLIGYNTDGPGFVRALCEETKTVIKGKRILLVGAGGAARGIYFALASEQAARIDICNRTRSTATQLIEEADVSIDSSVYSIEEAEKHLDEYEIIINTTPVGLYPNVEAMPLSLDRLEADTVVSDIIYNPLETKWLQEARQKRAIVQNGVGMFIYQGALAFEKWTGIFPDVKRMKQIVIQQLGGSVC
ncbi:shikimate dehydrogenase [Anoxybacillus rupiensis]|uniref:Shikimate dehydrogenase (NADP(+)) n=1 Tax=Anoxybacteroides rupiense TaxID=311460 RepID=A0ABD5ITY7_9BACL|nr:MULTISPECIES: shikimate dehydrogenase [Anoxybacillus]MBB3906933.1 shikimate dehydrogenase [Anoxybacillus rupiensis]MBS2769957.1 shikimate dehydrogenase [Anoxybacillus rupiensis]MDE8562671.1 shikimate dehydrogenase [Anoxybacillus rupiensis]MED5050916.1 shikimate dehydrogenase [Anoxybacillus rupiensis]OQM44870.1 shikimate dehydrogenase [Anoxybacillus sp. UARK-01]